MSKCVIKNAAINVKILWDPSAIVTVSTAEKLRSLVCFICFSFRQLCHVQLLLAASNSLQVQPYPAACVPFSCFRQLSTTCRLNCFPAACFWFSSFWQLLTDYRFSCFRSLCQVQVLPASSDSLLVQLFPTACIMFSCFRQHLTEGSFSCFRQLGKFSYILQVTYSILSCEYMTWISADFERLPILSVFNSFPSFLQTA